MHAQYCGPGVAIVPNNQGYDISVSPLMLLKIEILLDVNAVSIGKLLTDVSKDRRAFMIRAKQSITHLLDCLTQKSKALRSVTIHHINTA